MYPATVKHARQTEFAVGVAQSVVGDDNVEAKRKPLMGSEDFAFMLEERPGTIMLIGNGNSVVFATRRSTSTMPPFPLVSPIWCV